MEFCRSGIARPSMGRQGTSPGYGVAYLVIGAFRGAVILRPAYFLKYFCTIGRNLLRCVIIQMEIKKWNLC